MQTEIEEALEDLFFYLYRNKNGTAFRTRRANMGGPGFACKLTYTKQ